MRRKASNVKEAKTLRDWLDARGNRLVLTNGCFDILHAGHVRYLAEARALGEALVVALNDDASVRTLKGAGRPINPAEDRAEVLAALECVDGVVVFGGTRATEVIRELRPHVYAKGGDYTVESLDRNERAALEEAGADIHILGLVAGRSTSATLAKIGGGERAGGPLRLGVLGSGRGSNLEAICEAIGRGDLDASVVLVVSDVEDAPILENARRRGIQAAYVDPGPDPRRLADPAQDEIAERLMAAGCEVVALAGFMRVLKAPVLEAFPGAIVNIHPSLLPKFKGREAWARALKAGETETGCTVHTVTATVDEGEILDQIRVPVLADDTPESLLERIHSAEHVAYPRALAKMRARLRAGDSESNPPGGARGRTG
ncbi:hypothetical protein BH23VER1_BH23VER1_16410 [soil metagenome]